MFFALFIMILLGQIRAGEGAPTYVEEYRNISYVPQFVDTELGRQIVAPDTPYVARAGRSELYFIDTRFDVASAKHIKEQIERATVPDSDTHIYVDDITATAEVRTDTGEVPFVFDPAYARLFFASSMNKLNPSLNLPEHESTGDHLVEYEDGGAVLARRDVTDKDPCDAYSCSKDKDCKPQKCDKCVKKRIEDGCESKKTQAVAGQCNASDCSAAVDTPREDGETDASYYKRMDTMHWG